MKENKQKKLFTSVIPIFTLILLILIFVYQFFIYSPQMKIKQSDLDKEIEYANELINKGLYSQGVEVFQELLTSYKLKKEKKSNIVYRLGLVYQDQLNDFANALRYYYKINVMYPEFSMIGDVKKRIVQCLERLDKSLDAKNELSRFASMNDKKEYKQDHSEIIAQIGDRKITYGEFDGYLMSLPESIREKGIDKETRSKLLQEYIVGEILFESAQRSGYENDSDVSNALYQAKKAILVNKLLTEKIGEKIKDVDPTDLMNYYQSNISRYKAPDSENALPFEKVQDKVLNDYLMEKQQSVYENYIRELLRTSNVKIMESTKD